MRVLQLISSAGYYGAENMLVTLARELNLAGVHTTVGALQTGAEPELIARARALSLPAETFACNGRVDASLPSHLNRFLRENRIDVLHTHGYKANLYTRFSSHAARQVATCHNWAVRTGSLGFYSVLDRMALRRVPAVAAVSDGVAQRLAEFGVKGPRVHVISNGVDLARFASAEPSLRNHPKLAGKTVIGVVSRLTPGKGLDLLLDAFTKLDSHCALAVVGAGPLDAELQQQAAAVGIADRVLFTGARNDMPEVYSSFDLFCLPSLDEGLPMSVLEAIAAGVPVVATGVGGVPSLIGEGRGYLIPAGETAALTAALNEALSDRSAATTRAAAARAHIEANFSSAAMARNYLRLYEAVLAGAAQAA